MITSQHILISRTDAIGDVVLTLPLCGYLKEKYPGCKISFLGRSYTEPVIKACSAINEFVNYDEIKILPLPERIINIQARKIDVVVHIFPRKEIAGLVKKAGIKIRIGTANRVFHWFTCNRLVKLTRRNSDLHEAQLNIKLLEPLGIGLVPAIAELPAYYNFKPVDELPQEFAGLLDPDRLNIILHPKSNGSAREWDIKKFTDLISLLPAEKFKVFISGAQKEKGLLQTWIQGLPGHVVDITGKLSLGQLITFISKADGLVAASTGPLHIAAAVGIHSLGLYPTGKSVNAGRWGPVGLRAGYLESNADDLNNISAMDVYDKIKSWTIE